MGGEPDNFFDINIIFLKYSGLFPPKNKSTVSYKVYKVFRFFAILITVILGTTGAVIGVIENMYNFNVLIELLNVALTMFLSATKSVFWLINAKSIEDIMETLETNAFYYEETEDFKPSLVKEKAKRIGRMYTLILWYLTQLTLGFAYIPAICLSLWYYVNDLPIANTTTFRTLPYYIHIPFAYDTAIKYCFACIVQAIPCYLYANILVGVDTLFMNLLNLIGTHMLVLQGAFKTMRKRCMKQIDSSPLTSDGLYNSKELEYRMMLEMKKAINHLQMLFRCCYKLEEIFKYVSLFQALGSVFILCSSLLMISTTSCFTKEFGNEIFYFIGINVQMGLYCSFGNQVTLKALDLPQAIWESDWLESRRPFKTCILMTMMRLKKPIYLTAGKFAPLLLNTHISVLKGSYSYYTVLKTMDK